MGWTQNWQTGYMRETILSVTEKGLVIRNLAIISQLQLFFIHFWNFESGSVYLKVYFNI